jgi:hypothetical protein
MKNIIVILVAVLGMALALPAASRTNVSSSAKITTFETVGGTNNVASAVDWTNVLRAIVTNSVFSNAMSGDFTLRSGGALSNGGLLDGNFFARTNSLNSGARIRAFHSSSSNSWALLDYVSGLGKPTMTLQFQTNGPGGISNVVGITFANSELYAYPVANYQTLVGLGSGTYPWAYGIFSNYVHITDAPTSNSQAARLLEVNNATNWVGGNFVKSLSGYAVGLTAVTFTATNELIIRAHPGWSIYNPSGDNAAQYVEASSPNLAIQPYGTGYRHLMVIGSPITAAGPNQNYEYGFIVSGTNGAFGSIIFDGTSTFYGGGDLGTTNGFHWGNLFISGNAFWQDGSGPRWVGTSGGLATNLVTTNETFLGLTTWTSTTNNGGGSAILTNFAFGHFTNSVNTNVPTIIIRSPVASIGTNPVFVYGLSTGAGTTNRLLIRGDGSIFQPTNGGAGFTSTNSFGGKSVFPTNVVIGPDDGNSGLMIVPSGSSTISVIRSGGSVGDGTHMMTFVMNGPFVQFRGGLKTADATITNYAIHNRTLTWPSAAAIGATNGALVVSNNAGTPTLYWLYSTDGATTNAVKIAP